MELQSTTSTAALPTLPVLRAAGPTPALAPKVATTAAGGVDATKKDSAEPDLKQVHEAVDNINKAMQTMSRSIEFSVDTDSDRTVIKIIDQQTREVIRQMPSAEALEIGKALEKMQGLLLHQTA